MIKLETFGLENSFLIKPLGNRHINNTYQVGNPPRYVLQKINTAVFTDPEALMKNVVSVTTYLREQISEAGGDPNRETLTYLTTKTGANICRDEEGNYWRMYHFIKDTYSYDSATPQLFADSARAFAKFQRMLSDFPAATLNETIPKFHDTGARLEQLKTAIAENKSGRADSVRSEIDFALSHAEETHIITDAIADGSVPLRVTHNDTKLNNVLFDSKTRNAICVIDLDTVMHGSLLYDYGDALRFGASTAAEDETDLSKVHFDLDLFRAYTQAYLEVLGDRMTKREIELLPMGAKLMTLECGMRFLADHINGDTYFHIHREGHNLDRARTQFKLVSEIEEKTAEMNAVIREAIDRKN